MAEEELIISLLQEQQEKIQEELEEQSNANNNIIEENRELIEDLKRDKNTIININIEIIAKILNELQVEEKEEIIKHFEVIQTLLKLNKEEHTTYKLTETQLEYINLFLKQVETYEKQIQKEYQTKKQHQKEYQQLLDKLNDKREPITELNILKHLFKDRSLDEETQSRILIALMKYNKDLSDDKEATLPNWDNE